MKLTILVNREEVGKLLDTTKFVTLQIKFESPIKPEELTEAKG